MDVIDFSVLDNTETFIPDTAAFQNNLTAAAEELPEYVEQLRETAPPEGWRAVRGLDGFPTYRTESAGERPAWLVSEAAPRAFAEGTINLNDHADKNPALSTISSGASLIYLLEQLTQQQAVYVFERDPALLAAALRNIDLSEHIRSGRCILLPADEEESYLKALLERRRGLEPPGTLVTQPNLDRHELERIQTICERIAKAIHDDRSRRMAELTAPEHIKTLRCDEGSLAIVALGKSTFTHQRAGELAAAARKLGRQACLRTGDGPGNVHMLPHSEALAASSPSLAIYIDQAPKAAPLPAGCRVCRWHLSARSVPREMPTDDALHLAASPTVAKALREAGAAADQIEKMYWGACSAEETWSNPPSVSDDQAGFSKNAAALFGHLPDMDPSACGIEQPTHKQLWAQLQETAFSCWDTPDILRPAALLNSAERASGIKLGDARLHERMVLIIEHILIPAVVLRTIAEDLHRRSFEVWTVGGGWRGCTDTRVKILADHFDQLSSPATHGEGAPAHTLKPVAAVIAGSTDPLCPELFYAATRRWPLLIHDPGVRSTSERLGGVLHPEQHFLTFSGSTQLGQSLEAIRRDPSQTLKRLERTFEHVQRNHTYEQRLLELEERLRLDQSVKT